MTLRTTLIELGFNHKELAVYISLLKHGKQTPAQLAKHTKINRATIYNVTKSLQNKGVVADDSSGKTRYYYTLPPDSIRELVERPIRELEERRSLAEKAAEEVSLATVDDEYPVPSIRFIQESELQDFLYSNIPKWLKSVKKVDSAWWGTQDSHWLENFQEFNDWYWKHPLSKGVKMNLVGNESHAEMSTFKKHISKQRNVRFETDMLFTSSIWIGGDYMIMICTRNHPFYAVEIHDKTLAHNMREVFKKLWSGAAI